jgi:hypothetical protein
MFEDRYTNTEAAAAAFECAHSWEPPERPDPSEYEDEDDDREDAAPARREGGWTLRTDLPVALADFTHTTTSPEDDDLPF